MVYDNRNWGIFYELSYGGTKIHDNTLTNNGLGDGTANWFNNVQLLVSCSDGSVGAGIEIYDNTIDGAAYPLGTDQSQPSPHPHEAGLRPRQRHDPARPDDQGGSRRVRRADRAVRRPRRATVSTHNTYRVLDRNAAYWAWNGQTLTWAQWQATGHDVNGVLELIA